jgi:hypothetical protein
MGTQKKSDFILNELGQSNQKSSSPGIDCRIGIDPDIWPKLPRRDVIWMRLSGIMVDYVWMNMGGK